MSEDRLHLLSARLNSLAAEPLAAHPGVLEDIHRGLVAELDALADAGASSRG